MKFKNLLILTALLLTSCSKNQNNKPFILVDEYDGMVRWYGENLKLIKYGEKATEEKETSYYYVYDELYQHFFGDKIIKKIGDKKLKVRYMNQAVTSEDRQFVLVDKYKYENQNYDPNVGRIHTFEFYNVKGEKLWEIVELDTDKFWVSPDGNYVVFFIRPYLPKANEGMCWTPKIKIMKTGNVKNIQQVLSFPELSIFSEEPYFKNRNTYVVDFINKSKNVLRCEIDLEKAKGKTREIKPKEICENCEKQAKEIKRWFPENISAYESQEFANMFCNLQKSVLFNEREKVASLICYPIMVYGEFKKPIKSKAEFINNYDKIIDYRVFKAIVRQKLKDFFGNWAGASIGRGEMWFNTCNDSKNIMVTTINTGPRDY